MGKGGVRVRIRVIVSISTTVICRVGDSVRVYEMGVRYL